MKAGSLLALVCCLGACRAAPPDELYVLADSDVESIDPHASGGRFSSQTLLASVYEGLVARDAELRILPGLAVSWSNPDDRTWDFVLRPGVRFHDGSTLVAKDVVDSIRRALQHPRSVVRGDLANVSEVSAPDPATVRLRTREPDAALLSLLPEVFVMSGAAARGVTEIERASQGTGPYRIAARTPGVSVELERFEHYWGGAPALRRIHVLPVAWGTPEAERQVPPGAPLIFYAVPGTPEFERASREHVLYERPGLPVQYLGFDLRPRDSPGVRLPAGEQGNPFLDPRVRSAVALSIDYERLLSSILAGKTRPATQMVPPQALGFDPGLAKPRRDLAEARRLMALSAFRHGFEVDLDVREFVGQYFVPHLVEGLGQIGIRARVRTFADQEFFDHLRAGRSSLYLLRFSCRTGDAQEFFDKIIHSRDEAHGYGVFNFSYDQSPRPELDQRIEEARRTTDPPQRLLRLQDVMRRVIGERLVVPLLSERGITFLSRGLTWTPRADGFRMFAEMRPAP